MNPHRVRVVDSHTEGEPTRVVVEGGPDLGPGTAAERRQIFRELHDDFRSSVVNEPRGWDALVGAMLLDPVSPEAVTQVIFFNNVDVLLGCIHGTIGVAATLRHLGRIGVGRHRIETPVGDVHVVLSEDDLISVENVESYRHRKDVIVETEKHGTVVGDVAYGGNWFFLVSDGGRIDSARIDDLTAFSSDIRRSLVRHGVTGADGAEIDHVELFGPASVTSHDSRNFVLCPGNAYDRSPCGTGTSAKLACLAADGRLSEGEIWHQESIIGSHFAGSIRKTERGVIPTIAGRAWITAESTLVIDPDDPFAKGIRL